MLHHVNERPIVLANLAYLSVFTVIAWRHSNHEFLLYAVVVIVLVAALYRFQHRLRLDRTVLWGLTAWGLLHMAGGNLRVHGDVLYGLQLIPVVLRYDQAVHFLGFCVATLACHQWLSRHLRDPSAFSAGVAALVILLGCGLGALNEVLEFIAVKIMPETGVGGYENTMWDLVFNLLGSLAAAVWIALRARARRMAGPSECTSAA